MDVLRATDKACGYIHSAHEQDTSSGLLSTVYSADYELLRYNIIIIVIASSLSVL